MEWASNIEVHDGKMVARVLDANGASSLIPLEHLASRGLPIAKTRSFSLGAVSASTLKQVPSTEYSNAWGFSGLCDSQIHQVYELATPSGRVLIPALLLMREFFRPTRHLLPHLFLPHALEQLYVRCPVQEGAIRTIHDWRLRNHQTSRVLHETLAWIENDDSMREMALSVHAHAMKGEIGIALKPIQFDTQVRGVTLAGDFFATSITISRIYSTSASKAFQVESGLGQRRYKTAAPTPVAGFAQTHIVLPTEDGRAAMSDAEWAQVEPLMLIASSRSDSGALRRMLDLILPSLSAQEPPKWKSLGTGEFTSRRVWNYYTRWVRSGVMARVIELVNAGRTQRVPG